MAVELKAALTEAFLPKCAGFGHGDMPRAVATEFAEAALSVLASLQAPCPGKAGVLRERVAQIIDATCERLNDGQPICAADMRAIQGALGKADAVLALLSAQPVPSEDQGSVAGEAVASSALPRQAGKGSAPPSGLDQAWFDEVEDFLDDYSDAEIIDGRTHPNNAMRLLCQLREGRQ